MKVCRGAAVSAVLYAVWLLIYMISQYTGLIALPDGIHSLVLLSVTAVYLILSALMIPESRYAPAVIIVFFILLAAMVAFSADVISLSDTGNRLFRLSFGEFGFFIICLLYTGLFRFILHETNPGTRRFHPVAFSSLLLFLLPVFSDIISEGLSAESVYSIIFTAAAVWCFSAAVVFMYRVPEKKLFAYAAAAAVLIEMTVYIYRFPVPEFIPEELHHLLFPFSFLLLIRASAAESGRCKDD